MTRLNVAALASMALLGGRAAAGPAQDWRPGNAPLMTRWAQDVSPTNALPEYPRPQMVRQRWQNLNGLWDYAVTTRSAEQRPAAWDGKISD